MNSNVEYITSFLRSYSPQIATVLALAFLFSFTGCTSVKDRLGPAGTALVGGAVKVYTHGKIREEASQLMVDYLAKHPGSARKLPMLNAAWDHFWQNENPFTAEEFALWRAGVIAENTGWLYYEIEGFNVAADLLWEYLEAGTAENGYVKVSPRTRRLVDSFVQGLREGYAKSTR